MKAVGKGRVTSLPATARLQAPKYKVPRALEEPGAGWPQPRRQRLLWPALGTAGQC